MAANMAKPIQERLTIYACGEFWHLQQVDFSPNHLKLLNSIPDLIFIHT